MSLKLNILAENTKELPKPKNVRSINVDTIAEKYAYQANEKGVSGLSNFFNYFITDEWVEIEKPNKERLPENKRYYLGLITILFDKQTGEPVKKGGISLNKLVQPYPAYDGEGIKQIKHSVWVHHRFMG